MAALPLVKEPALCIELEAGWTPEPLWTILRREVSCPYCKSNHNSFGVHPVAQLTYWLQKMPFCNNIPSKTASFVTTGLCLLAKNIGIFSEK